MLGRETLIITPAFAQPHSTGSDVVFTLFLELCLDLNPLWIRGMLACLTSPIYSTDSAVFKSLHSFSKSFGNESKERNRSLARATLPPLYQNCHCWNPSPDNKPNCSTFKKRICINQSVIGGCQIKYRRAGVKELGIVQIYISAVFPVISPLLGSRAPRRRHHFHNSARD